MPISVINRDFDNGVVTHKFYRGIKMSAYDYLPAPIRPIYQDIFRPVGPGENPDGSPIKAAAEPQTPGGGSGRQDATLDFK